jgi:phospholipase C
MKELKQYESVEEAFKQKFGHLEYADNFRAAQVGNAEEMEAYTQAMREGCCGRVDTVVMIAHAVMLGDEWHKWYEPHLLGCNYGH